MKQARKTRTANKKQPEAAQCVNEKKRDKKHLDSCACWLQSVMTVQTTYQKHLAVLDREQNKPGFSAIAIFFSCGNYLNGPPDE